MRLYRIVDNDQEYELTAKSMHHAIMLVYKFHPESNPSNYFVEELTILGSSMTRINLLNHGDAFKRCVRLTNGQYTEIGGIYTKGDFDPTRNQYQCMNDARRYEYLDTYQVVVKCDKE